MSEFGSYMGEENTMDSLCCELLSLLRAACMRFAGARDVQMLDGVTD